MHMVVGVHLCGCMQVFVNERKEELEDLQSSHIFLLLFFQATRAEGKPHGPTGL